MGGSTKPPICRRMEFQQMSHPPTPHLMEALFEMERQIHSPLSTLEDEHLENGFV